MRHPLKSFSMVSHTLTYKPILLATLLVITLSAIPFALFSQSKKDFTLVIKAPPQFAHQMGAGEAFYLKQYKSAEFLNDSARYNNGQFSFTGQIQYPTAVRIWNNDKGNRFNQLLFIEPGYQEVTVSIHDSTIVLQRPDTKIEKEYKQFMNFMNVADLNQKLSLPLMEKYIQGKPASYIVLFALIDQTFNYNFQPGFRQLVNLFDSTILTTKGFRYYENQYLIHNKIPALIVKDAKDKNINLQFKRQDGKYTLVEFWWVGCKGCISLMKEMKEKYYTAISDKVRVISVSTDSRGIKLQSIKKLNQLAIPWEAYWDFDASAFSKHALLYIYPTNLLINDKGYIVGKDVDISTIPSFFIEAQNK